jgi:FKBP-type peptidyl-prolyl cis-trans isomerase FkpA
VAKEHAHACIVLVCNKLQNYKHMKKTAYFIPLALAFLFVWAGCSKNNNTSQQADKDHQLILDYVASHHLQGHFTHSGLYYVITAPGSSKHPTLQSTVYVDYKGYFLDGKIFDQGNDISFPLSRVIQGWQEGLQLVGENGKITLLVPSGLAYGNQQSGVIPPNTVLAFDITLLSVSN